MDYKSHRSLINAAIFTKRRSLLNEQDAMLAGAGAKPNPLLDPRAAQQTQERSMQLEKARKDILAAKEQAQVEEDLLNMYADERRAKRAYAIGLGTPYEGAPPLPGELTRGEELLINNLRTQVAAAEDTGRKDSYISREMAQLTPLILASKLEFDKRSRAKTSPKATAAKAQLKAGEGIEQIVGENLKFTDPDNFMRQAAAINPDLLDDNFLDDVMASLPDKDKQLKSEVTRYKEQLKARRSANRDYQLDELISGILEPRDEGRLGDRYRSSSGDIDRPKHISIERYINSDAMKADFRIEAGMDPIPGGKRKKAPASGSQFERYNQLKDQIEKAGFSVPDVDAVGLDQSKPGQIDPRVRALANSQFREMQEIYKAHKKAMIRRVLEPIFDAAYGDVTQIARQFGNPKLLDPTVASQGRPALMGDPAEAAADVVRRKMVDALKYNETGASSPLLKTFADLDADYKSTDPAVIRERQKQALGILDEKEYFNAEFEFDPAKDEYKVKKVRGSNELTPLQQVRQLSQIGSGYEFDVAQNKWRVRPATVTTPDINAPQSNTRPLSVEEMIDSGVLRFDRTAGRFSFADSSRPLSPLGKDLKIDAPAATPEHAELLARARELYGEAPELTPAYKRDKTLLNVGKGAFNIAKVVGLGMGTNIALEGLGNFFGVGFNPEGEWQERRDLAQSAISYGAAGTLSSMMERGGNFWGGNPFVGEGNIFRGGVPSAIQGLAIDYISKGLGTDTSIGTNLIGTGVGMATTPAAIRLSQQMAKMPGLYPKLALGALALPTAAEAAVHAVGSMFEGPKTARSLKEFYGTLADLSKEQQAAVRKKVEEFVNSPSLKIQTRPSGQLKPGEQEWYDALEQRGLLGVDLNPEERRRDLGLVIGGIEAGKIRKARKAAQEQLNTQSQIGPNKPQR